jgi:hypothetical protein
MPVFRGAEVDWRLGLVLAEEFKNSIMQHNKGSYRLVQARTSYGPRTSCSYILLDNFVQSLKLSIN